MSLSDIYPAFHGLPQKLTAGHLCILSHVIIASCLFSANGFSYNISAVHQLHTLQVMEMSKVIRFHISFIVDNIQCLSTMNMDSKERK